MLESEIERRMCDMIKRRGGLTYKFTSPNNPGVPDRIVIAPGGIVWFVELKTSFGRLANIQKWQAECLREKGANVCVIRGWDAAKEFVNEVFPDGLRAT